MGQQNRPLYLRSPSRPERTKVQAVEAIRLHMVVTRHNMSPVVTHCHPVITRCHPSSPGVTQCHPAIT